MSGTRAGRRGADREERRARIRSMVMTVVPGLSEAAWATAMQAISPSEASAFATSTSTWPPTLTR